MVSIKSRKINFAEKLKTKKKYGQNKSARTPVVVVLAVVAVVLLAFEAVFIFAKLPALRKERDKLLDYVAVNKASADEAAKYEQIRAELYGEKTYLVNTDGIINSFYDFNSELYDFFADVAEQHAVTINSLSYSRSAGSVNLTLSAGERNLPGEFVTALEDSGLFSVVSFNGFDSSGDLYTFSVSCIFAPKEVTQE